MTDVFELIEVDAEGNLTKRQSVQQLTLRVNSDEFIPKGFGKGAEVYIIDLCNGALCDGKGNWYGMKDGNVVSGTAGQTWAAMFA